MDPETSRYIGVTLVFLLGFFFGRVYEKNERDPPTSGPYCEKCWKPRDSNYSRLHGGRWLCMKCARAAGLD
jgi:hypothetical protein